MRIGETMCDKDTKKLSVHVIILLAIVVFLGSCINGKDKPNSISANPKEETIETEKVSPSIMIISPDDLEIEMVYLSQLLEDENISLRYSLSLRDCRASNKRLILFLEPHDKLLSSLTLGPTDTGNFSDFNPLLMFNNLESLKINNYFLTDISGIAVLTKLEKLSSLTLWAKQVNDISSLSSFINLKELSIDVSNMYTDASELLPLENLERLFFCPTSTKTIQNLSQLTSLIELGLTFETTGIDISSLRNMTNLKRLHLIIHTDAMPELDIMAIGQLINLEYLYIEGFSINDVNPLVNLPNLSTINVMFSTINEKNIKLLKASKEVITYNDIDR
jgi:hypothetical protein